MIEQKKKTGQKYFPIVDLLNQCVEIGSSFEIDKDQKLIIGRLPWDRIYVNTERLEAIDKLYSCFVKHTKRMTIKYKSNNPYDKYLYHCFPEAHTIISIFLNRGSETTSYKGYGIDLYFVDGFPEQYSVK